MSFLRRRREAEILVPACSCGAPLDLVDMDYGFQLPDEVFDLPDDEQRERLRGLAKVFVLDETRGFVRSLLLVRLDIGSVEFGIWLEVPAAQAEAAMTLWEEPAYTSLAFEGVIANQLAPWGDPLLAGGPPPNRRPRTRFPSSTAAMTSWRRCLWRHGRDTSSCRFCPH